MPMKVSADYLSYRTNTRSSVGFSSYMPRSMIIDNAAYCIEVIILSYCTVVASTKNNRLHLTQFRKNDWHRICVVRKLIKVYF